jgi:diguanylate cyclase (GGDEF)-like protein
VVDKMGLPITKSSRLSLILEWLDHQSRGFLILMAILLDVLVGLLDHLTGYEISFSVFYLVPVVLISRCKGRIEGPVICCICAATWLVADLTSGHEYSQFWIPYWNALVRLGFFLAVSFSLRAMRCSMQSLEDMSRMDPLTGAANPRGFRERAQMEIDRALRYGHAITVAYLDVDDFKAINDNYGHGVGDQVLARIGELLSCNIRSSDMAARLGGDEFAIMFPETGTELARGIMNRIHEHLSEDMRVNGWPVTFSGGAVSFVVPPNSVEEMINKADDLMYKSKIGGKNKLTFAALPDRNPGI